MTTTEILNFLETLYTPLVSDAMDKLGIHGRVLHHSIKSIISDAHIKCAGVAYPCQVNATSEYIEINTLLEMVDSIPTDAMVVVASDTDIGAALWGGMMSTRAKARGARGAVVSGGVRDIEQIADLGFAVFGEYACVTDIRTRGQMVSHNIGVQFNGVRIEPGDVVFADSNGVVVLPQLRLNEIVDALVLSKQNEDKTMNGLSKGDSAQVLYSEYHAF